MKTSQSQFETLYPTSNQYISPSKLDNKDIFSSLNLQCKAGNDSFEYCCQQNCKVDAVICQKPNCICQTYHTNCDNFSRVNKLHQKINDKIIHNTKDIAEQIQQCTDRIQNKVSNLYNQFQQYLPTFGLNDNQQIMKICIFKHFNQNQQRQTSPCLRGQKIFLFRANQKQADKDWFDYSLNKCKKMVKDTQKAIEPIFKQMETLLTYMHRKNKPNRQLYEFFCESRIISTPSQKKQSLSNATKYLLDILNQDMPVNSIKKVYQFKIKNNMNENLSNSNKIPFNKQEFLDACNGRNNLLFVIRNTNGNRFGGFSYGRFTSKSDKLQQFEYKKSFLFSLDVQHCQKINLNKSGILYNANDNRLQIGQSLVFPFVLNQKSKKLTFNFVNNDLRSQLQFNSTVHQSKKDNYGRQIMINYETIHGSSKSTDHPTKLGYLVYYVEVYQVYFDPAIQQIQRNQQTNSIKKQLEQQQNRNSQNQTSSNQIISNTKISSNNMFKTTEATVGSTSSYGLSGTTTGITAGTVGKVGAIGIFGQSNQVAQKLFSQPNSSSIFGETKK